ncbi:MAG: hypothetical protein KC501_22060 [Myxococcales bacterium]|nr:hypothetical protein [Myxococcales bacterium]
MNRRALRFLPALALLLPTSACYSGVANMPAAGDDESADGGDAGDDSADGADAGDDSGDAGDDGADDGGDDGEPLAPFDPSEPESYVRKVKQLLTGEPVQASELALVQADPAALRDLVREWSHTEAFRAKMLEFFTVSFQQEQVTKANIVSQIRAADMTGNFDPRPELYANLSESFARTAWQIVEEGRPFNEVAYTKRWQMTTAMMSFLVAADDPPPTGNNGGIQHTFYHNDPPAGMSASSSVAQQVAAHAWYVPRACVDPSYVTNKPYFVFPGLMGHLDQPGCNDFEGAAVMSDADFSDWREVEIVASNEGGKIPYFDVPQLRQSATLPLEVNRAGYFSTPAFLAKWRSNVDNSFRVTTNQALIVGLGQSFDDEDATLPLDDSGLSEDHADPTTVCYACHVSLDPMRNFFLKELDADFYSALDEQTEDQPSFAFFGEVREGDTLDDLGHAIAEHPFFAGAWVQKLCYFANSQECDPQDPEFERIRAGFEQGGFDFRELVVELFSSPLVTGTEQVVTHQTHEYLLSITRRDHLCRTLDIRLGIDNVCNGNNNVAAAVPEDAWSRGSGTPFQPAGSSLFYAATLEAFCSRTAGNVVDAEGSPLQSSDMEASVTFLVETLMDLSADDWRSTMAREAIEDHITAARELTANDRVVLESAFTLACSSPFVASVGY